MVQFRLLKNMKVLKTRLQLNIIFQYFAACILLVLGLTNPTSGLDSFINYFIFGMIFIFLTLIPLNKVKDKKNLTRQIIQLALIVTTAFSLTLLFKMHVNFIYLASAGLLIGFAIAYIFFNHIKKQPVLLLLTLIIAYIFTAALNSSELRTTIKEEPVNETYFNDQLSFLKVFYLVEKGYDYYSAHKIAHISDGRSDTIPQQVWGWRLPTYAYMWNIFPGQGGISVYFFFILLSVAAIYYTYNIARFFIGNNLAILSPYLIFPYFHFAARDMAFLHMEWWSVCFFIIGLYFYITKKLKIAILLFIITVFLREILIIPVFALLLLTLFYRKYKHLFSLITVFVFFQFFLLFHFLSVTEYISRSFNSLLPRDHPIGVYFLQQTLSYGSWEYLGFKMRPFILLAIINLISSILLALRKAFSFEHAALLATSISMAVAVIKIGTPPYDDYWGAAYVPLILISAPILVFSLFHKTQNAKID